MDPPPAMIKFNVRENPDKTVFIKSMVKKI